MQLVWRTIRITLGPNKGEGNVVPTLLTNTKP